MAIKQPTDLTSSNYYMQFSTYAIVATLAGMLGLWWYNHAPSHSTIVSSQTLAIADMPNLQDNKQVTPNTVRIPLAPIASAIAPGANINTATTAAAATTATAAPLPAAASPAGPTIASATPAATKPAVTTKHTVKDNDDDDDDEDDNN